MAMKTAPKRKLVSMDAPSREAVRKGNDNDAAGKTGLLENGVDIYTIKDLRVIQMSEPRRFIRTS